MSFIKGLEKTAVSVRFIERQLKGVKNRIGQIPGGPQRVQAASNSILKRPGVSETALLGTARLRDQPAANKQCIRDLLKTLRKELPKKGIQKESFVAISSKGGLIGAGVGALAGGIASRNAKLSPDKKHLAPGEQRKMGLKVLGGVGIGSVAGHLIKHKNFKNVRL